MPPAGLPKNSFLLLFLLFFLLHQIRAVFKSFQHTRPCHTNTIAKNRQPAEWKRSQSLKKLKSLFRPPADCEPNRLSQWRVLEPNGVESGTTISINLSFPHCVQLLRWTEMFSCPFLKTTIYLLLGWPVHSTTATFVNWTNCFGICCKKDLVGQSAKRGQENKLVSNIHLSNDDKLCFVFVFVFVYVFVIVSVFVFVELNLVTFTCPMMTMHAFLASISLASHCTASKQGDQRVRVINSIQQ